MSILELLSQKLMMSTSELRLFINTAPYRYKVYPVPKRSGKGVRIIAQPTDVLKMMQRMVADEFLSGLPIHACATAYREGLSIKDNAEAHVKNQYLLKMDFSDFFPSMGPSDLVRHVSKHKGSITAEDAYMVKKLFFWARKKDPTHRLSIGAPSSPLISNTLMYEFDCTLQEYCDKLSVTYTRYADDITLTTNIKGVLLAMPNHIKELCGRIAYPTLKVNEAKTVFSSKKNNRHVTGLVISNEDKISLGRERKRYIRSLIHKSVVSDMTNEEMYNLRGLLAFAKHIEPTFYDAIAKKYGLPAIFFIEAFQPAQKTVEPTI
ncbi:retron St85 family RNA-directed DNA polymerase [Pseudomonas gessardii]|jgi:RNA-directed DNA polymerase|uniref:RNA-directed DNA polymerase n=1 Tax=Pseudomonas gessardii TaxID=78544 RepID=A0A7Y1MWI3_9PSED|nr:retron St85 family RNA-directed DNA polymerase [Pseudomonas gessardii]NNA99322.1 RNA-directed DNA polymerase [Pseudomonas gessardii]